MHRSGVDESRATEESDQAHHQRLGARRRWKHERLLADRDHRLFTAVGARRNRERVLGAVGFEDGHRDVAPTERRGECAHAIDEVLDSTDRSGYLTAGWINVEWRQRLHFRQRRRIRLQFGCVVEQHDAVTKVDLYCAEALAVNRRRSNARLAVDYRDRADRVGVVEKLAQRNDGEVELADALDHFQLFCFGLIHRSEAISDDAAGRPAKL